MRLWQQHRPALLLRCLRLLEGNKADAEDALSTAALNILDHLSHDETIRDPVAWFHRLIFNVCMDTHRRRRREGALQSSGGTCEPMVAESAIDSTSSDSAEQTYLRRELLLEVRSGLDALPFRLRRVLLLRLDDTAYSDIAQAHGISIENARKQVQQARDLLRARLLHRDLLR